jgi:WD40 repeat protein
VSFYSLAFSPDGKKLACGFSDESRVLDLTTGRELYRLTGRPIMMSFTPDGRTLIASTGSRLRLWDAATGKELHERPGDFGDPLATAMSPDGGLLAAADWLDRHVSLWDVTDGRLVRRLPLLKGGRRYVRNLAFTADGKTLVASRYQGLLQSWDVATGKDRRTVQLDDPARPKKDFVYLYQLHVSPDGRHVSTLERVFAPWGESTSLARWDAATGKLLRQHPQPALPRECAWRPDGKAVALLLSDALTLIEVESGLVRFRAPGASAGPVAASPDYRLLAARRAPGDSVGVWESATGQEVTAVATGRVAHFALAPDNRSLVTADEGFLRVWDLATGKERRRWALPVAMTDSWGRTFVHALRLSPDGRRAITALADGTALIWNSTPAPAGRLVKAPGEKETAAWWADLAGADAGRAYAAVWRLAELPEETAVSFLRRYLRPAPEADPREVQKQIDALDSDTFAVREQAFKRLEGLGGAAVPALLRALAKGPPLEVRRRLEKLLALEAGRPFPPEVLRRLRALQVLERVASKGARRLLAELARGAAHAPETEEATAALERLSRRAGPP